MGKLKLKLLKNLTIQGGEEFRVNWWDQVSSIKFSRWLSNFLQQLDVIGINAYYPLVTVPNPSIDDLVNGWTRIKYGDSQNNITGLHNLTVNSFTPFFFDKMLLGFTEQKDLIY